MANPSSTMTEIVTTTLRNRTGKLADNVTENNALLMRLKKKGKVDEMELTSTRKEIQMSMNRANSEGRNRGR